MSSVVRLDTFVDPQFGENGYVVSVADGGPCWLVDPGFAPAGPRMAEHVKKKGLQPQALILTHGHLDHIVGVPDIVKAFPDVPVWVSEEAAVALADPEENLSAQYGFPIVVKVGQTHDLPAGGTLKLGGTDWRVFDTSGHAPGSRSLYCAAAGLVIVGDALFYRSIGRTDFHHSRHAQLIRNIREHLLTLPDETQVYSGHGPVTTVGAERRMNPFIQAGAEEMMD